MEILETSGLEFLTNMATYGDNFRFTFSQAITESLLDGVIASHVSKVYSSVFYHYEETENWTSSVAEYTVQNSIIGNFSKGDYEATYCFESKTSDGNTNSMVELYINGVEIGECAVASTSWDSRTCIFPFSLEMGEHTVKVQFRCESTGKAYLRKSTVKSKPSGITKKKILY